MAFVSMENGTQNSRGPMDAASSTATPPNPPTEIPTNDDTSDTAAPKISDEELRKLLKPIPTEEDVYRILLDCYCDVGKDDASTPSAISTSQDPTGSIKVLCQLDSYDDCNFKVALNGQLFLLKVTNGLESEDYIQCCSKSHDSNNDNTIGEGSIINFQHSIMNVLNEHHICTTVPSAASPVTLRWLPVRSAAHSPSLLAVRLYTWVPGRPLSTIPYVPLESLLCAGQRLGQIDAALDTLDPMAAGRRYHQWDGRNTLDLRKFTGYIANTERRALVESILAAFAAQQPVLAASFRTGVIMGDYNDANIIVDEHLQFAGVIDFGDSVESWRVLDITIAMAYAMLTAYGKSDRSISAMAVMLRGYHSVYPLTAVEREHLVLLIACRLACSVTLGAFSFQQNPENQYLLLHSEPAWKALELIWGYDATRRAQMADTLNDVFHRACHYTTSDSDAATIPCSDLAWPDPCVVDLLRNIRIRSGGKEDK